MDIKEILAEIGKWWNQIQVWLPVWLTANSLLVWQICKSILNIITSKKTKIAMNNDIRKLEEKRKRDRKLILILFRVILKMQAVLRYLLVNIFNENVKIKIEKCLSETSKSLNEVKEILDDNEDSIESINENSEEVNADTSDDDSELSGDEYGTI